MDVRWERRHHTRNLAWQLRRGLEPESWWTRTPVLVKSQLVNGQARQRIVGYLASINEQELGQIGAQVRFWRAVALQLDALALPAAERAGVEATLAATVPRPTEAEARAWEDACQQHWALVDEVILQRGLS